MARILGTNFTDLLFGTTGNDSIHGYGGNDIIFGNGGFDSIFAGDGNDVVTITSAGGQWYGGVGIDSFVHSGTTGGTFNLQSGTTLISGRSGILDGFENLTTGSGHDIVTGSSSANVIRTGNGNDSISALGGNDSVWGGYGHDYIDGAEGNDVLYGENGNDTLVGGRGDDRLFGGYANDNLYGGDGDDLLVGGYGNDGLYGGAGYDTVSFADLSGGIFVSMASQSAQIRTAIGSAETDRIGVDIENIIGTAFDDLIFLSDHLDTETGGGNDAVWAGQGANYMNGGVGIDTLSYSNSTSGVTMRLDGSTGSGGWAGGDQAVGFENINGSQYSDKLWGNASANSLFGAQGNDILRGGLGDDTLSGGQGADTLHGAQGNDVFMFKSTDESAVGGSDFIVDFQTGDRIDISAIDANRHLGGMDDFFRVISVANSQSNPNFTAGTINVLHTATGTTRIEFNTSDNTTNGHDLPEMVIFLQGVHQIGLSDFIL